MNDCSEKLSVPALVEEIYDRDSRRIYATLVRLLRDFDAAEEAMQEAFTAAVSDWEKNGVPKNPRAWLVSAGRFKAIDAIRKRAKLAEIAVHVNERAEQIRNARMQSMYAVQDDQLRLIFACCHPALASEAQVALTLREVCGLSTEEIAKAFLLPTATLAQRIVRAKNKIKNAGIPFEIPERDEVRDRLNNVLQVIYLVYNEGYSATTGSDLVRLDLSSEAIRLGRLLKELLPDAEVLGLLALMLLHESRRATRVDEQGDVVLLEDQDRTRWNQAYIQEGKSLIESSLRSGVVGPFVLQAAISAVHASADTYEQTDWPQIVAIYNTLYRINPTPIVELNRAVAIAMESGPQVGLELIDAILDRGDLKDYHLAYAARADLCRRLNLREASYQAYDQALALVGNEPERRYLERRRAEVASRSNEQK